MTQTELRDKLNELCCLSAETEVFEFKEARNNYDFRKLGKYFSALSNEANLKGKPHAWLVFGIKDKDRTIVGTQFRKSLKDLHSLKGEIANKTTNHITFIENYELYLPEGRVIMFQIPAAPKGIPIAFEGHYYGRNGEELSPLNLEKIERIRIIEDWSAAIIPDAGMEDLDPAAIAKAMENYKKKFPEQAADMNHWDEITFLNKAKITIKNNITRTAILLLGKPESEHFLNPAEAKIRWILKDLYGVTKDYQIFTCPLLLAADHVYARIRNLKYRYIKEGTLFPEEVQQYEPYVIREALNNCIAHQDYTLAGRINVVEMDDQLIFSNLGNFIPGTIEQVIKQNAPEEHYRNRFLVTAMFNLKMVDTIGSGIRNMYEFQRQRFFPMPEYEIAPTKVSVTITGKVLDAEFAKTLARNPGLGLHEIILLDKVQKHKLLTAEETTCLKKKKLIEGRRPNFFISAQVAKTTEQKAEYSKYKAFDKTYYLDLIMKSIKEHGVMERKDIDQLLWKKLPDWMDNKQRENRIHNLLSELRVNNRIKNEGVLRKSRWVLIKEYFIES